jgi:L-seryl-tRNA(Ser) seleniumtransferase
MKELLRKIPKVDDILRHGKWKEFTGSYPETVARTGLQLVLDELRESIKEGELSSVPPVADIIDKAHRRAGVLFTPKLKRVVNGTGVIIHTNLGRSLLARAAIEGIMNASFYYSNLEYDLEKGTRGNRYIHCSSLLEKITGAESALVVNNNAGAVILALNTLAEGREVLISRGELVEIGGSFRIPDVMKKSGALLKEVGTTNRTYGDDYEHAFSGNTGLIMKIHASNFRIRGFSHAPDSEEIVELGRKYNVPTFLDAGSGLIFPLDNLGAHDEPCIPREVAKGFDLVCFSGDKLLGGPQAGILVGKKIYIDAMKKNPLARALRPDKFTLSGLENTLLLYLDEETAKRNIPTLQMIHAGQDFLKKRAAHLATQVQNRCRSLSVSVVEVSSEVGGGTLPDVTIPSYGIALKPGRVSIREFDRRLRQLEVPVVGRIGKDALLLDMRTVLAEDEPFIVTGVEETLENDQ